MICGIRFGMICLRIIVPWLTPRAFAAITKSRSLSVRVCARTTLATLVHEKKASIPTNVTRLRGINAYTTIINSKLGTDINTSTIRIINASTAPPMYPLMVPNSVPTITATHIAANPTSNEIRPPYKVLVNVSRPISSVPRICVLLIPCIFSATLDASGSYGERGAIKEAITIIKIRTVQTTAILFERNIFFIAFLSITLLLSLFNSRIRKSI